MSFQEISLTVSCHNKASTEFYRIARDAGRMSSEVKAHAESMSAGFREVARDLTTLGTGAMAVGRLAEQFGILSKEQANAISTMGSVITAGAAVVRAIDILRHSEIIATAVTWAYNASLAAKITLLTFGVGAVVVAAAAMSAMAMQTRAAAGAMREYNAAAAEMPTYTRSIRRAGEEDLRRKGIE